VTLRFTVAGATEKPVPATCTLTLKTDPAVPTLLTRNVRVCDFEARAVNLNRIGATWTRAMGPPGRAVSATESVPFAASFEVTAAVPLKGALPAAGV